MENSSRLRPNKAVEDDGDKRIFFGLRQRVTAPASFGQDPRHLPCLIHGFPHRASPLTFARRKRQYTMRPPKMIKPYVKSFARSVTGMADIELIYIKCTPNDCLSDGDCFPCVELKVQTCGGEAVLGWAIWERPNVMIEAELHAVWKSAEGIFQDIVPRQLPIPRILFVPDPRRRYKGIQVDNIRKALTHDKDVKELIRVFERAHRLLNEGDLAHYHGEIDLMQHPQLFAVEREKVLICQKIDNRYGPWLCEGATDSTGP